MKERVPAATQLPNLEHLRGTLQHVRLLNYVMVCCRVPFGFQLPEPPPPERRGFVTPGSRLETLTLERVLYSIGETYRSIQFMLADRISTDREKMRISLDAGLLYLENFLPKYTWKDIVRHPRFEDMNHKDHIYLVNECEGKMERDSSEMLFLFESNREKFITYMKERGKL